VLIVFLVLQYRCQIFDGEWGNFQIDVFFGDGVLEQSTFEAETDCLKGFVEIGQSFTFLIEELFGL
jgi:hypothetical protein